MEPDHWGGMQQYRMLIDRMYNWFCDKGAVIFLWHAYNSAISHNPVLHDYIPFREVKTMLLLQFNHRPIELSQSPYGT